MELLLKILEWLFGLWLKKCSFSFEYEKETTKTKIKFHKD